MEIRRRAWFYWAAVGSLGILCCTLAVLQYRWIGDISRAEHDRLKSALQSALNILSHDFNDEITAVCRDLQPLPEQIKTEGRQKAYGDAFQEWSASDFHRQFVSRVGFVVPQNAGVALFMPNSATRRFEPAKWPESWQQLKDRLTARVTRGARPPYAPAHSTLVEMPRFGSSTGARDMTEQEWLIVEIDGEFARNSLLPKLLEKHLGRTGVTGYQAEVVLRSDPSRVVYKKQGESQKPIGDHADASVTLFDVRPEEPGDRERESRMAAAPDSGRGRWLLRVQSDAGSLESVVARTRLRNLAVSAAILLLVAAAVFVLIRLSRQTEQLAELQMNFVAGVSHELRTPLSVIRTAAYNLRGKVAYNPAQVEQYGTLIQEETDKLTMLVEQVLRFANARAGRVIAERSPVAIEDVIDEALNSSRITSTESRYTIDKRLDPDLPVVLGDQVALTHAVQNLVENAIKYGLEGSDWIGITAARADGGRNVEIRVMDRGPGIPSTERERLFDAFFRGERAVQDQIHGTGLGLNLVKRIVEAHGGAVEVASEPMKRTEFIVTIPAAPKEMQSSEVTV